METNESKSGIMTIRKINSNEGEVGGPGEAGEDIAEDVDIAGEDGEDEAQAEAVDDGDEDRAEDGGGPEEMMAIRRTTTTSPLHDGLVHQASFQCALSRSS